MVTRWWQLKYFFMFTPIPREMIQFDEHMFQTGWFNHQLGYIADRLDHDNLLDDFCVWDFSSMFWPHKRARLKGSFYKDRFLGSKLLLFQGPAILQERQEDIFHPCSTKIWTPKRIQEQGLKGQKQQLLVFKDSFQRDSQVNLHLPVLVLFKRNPYHIFPLELILTK